MQGRERQRGVGLLSWLVIIAVVALLGTAAFRLVPVYMDNWTVNSVLSSVVTEPESGTRTPGELRRAIDARFLTNRVSVISARDIKITQERGVMVIDASYEVRVPLIYNIDAVVRFDDMVYEVPRR